MTTSLNGQIFIQNHEGCRLLAYEDSGGVWTIGYGHTGPDVTQGLVWTQQQADDALQGDLGVPEAIVNQTVTVPLNQNQFDALVSLVFNIGGGNFGKSTLLNLLNQKAYIGAAAQFLRWDKVDGLPVKGLFNRRTDERALFLETPA